MNKAQKQGRSHIGTYWSKDYKKVDLREDGIEAPLPGGGQKEHSFERGPVTATVDTAGNLAVTKTGTLTRWVAYGSTGASLFKKTEKHDTRELYLMIEGPDFASLLQCKPDDGSNVREFAAQINTASLSAPAKKQAREQVISDAQRRLESIRGNRDAIEAAATRVEVAKTDTVRVDAARSKVQETSLQSDNTRAASE